MQMRRQGVAGSRPPTLHDETAVANMVSSSSGIPPAVTYVPLSWRSAVASDKLQLQSAFKTRAQVETSPRDSSFPVQALQAKLVSLGLLFK